ncbi:MAG: 2-hydroxyacyl-CoA dehydratase [Planctomycetes bacterium]|nr:2-hydroxyacyl-CoA dehydratase [Planctomycetota bacterium]
MKDVTALINGYYRSVLAKLSRHKTVGYTCLYVPPELIEAYGFWPVRLAGLGNVDSENEGERFIHNEGCSFCKDCLGAQGLKRLPQSAVDYLVIPSTCDQMKRQGEKWHLTFNVPTYFLFVPKTWQDRSCQNAYRREIKWLSEELATLIPSGKPVRPLKEIIIRYNQARARMRDLGRRMDYHTRRLLMHLFFVSPIDDFLKYLDKVEQHLPEKATLSRRLNLMLVGSPVAYGDNFLDNILSEYPEINIAIDTTCTGQRALDVSIATNGNLIDNLASGYFQRPPCIWRRPNSQFYRYINECYSKYKIDGIIYKTLKFCDLWKYEFRRFREMVKHPMVQVENNYSPAQAGQFNKRISAFIEMIKSP